MPLNRFTWLDNAQFQQDTTLNVNDFGNEANLAFAIAALSGAKILIVRTTYDTPLYSQFNEPGSYPDVRDIADLTYVSGTDNRQVHLLIPAPIDGLFLGDNETVDPSVLVDLNSNVIGHVTSRGGDALTDFIGGKRRRLYSRQMYR